MTHFPPIGICIKLDKTKWLSFGIRKLLVFRWIPRSPRWLIANNHLEEAHEVLLKYAKYNHVTVDSKHLKHVIQEVRKNDARKSCWREVRNSWHHENTQVTEAELDHVPQLVRIKRLLGLTPLPRLNLQVTGFLQRCLTRKLCSACQFKCRYLKPYIKLKLIYWLS